MATTTTLPPAPAPVAPSPSTRRALIPKKLVRARPLFDPEILRRALKDSFVKLNPVTLMKNPVIFVVEVGAALVTAVPRPRHRRPAPAASASSCRSTSGSGSRCCSRTSPKRWRKRAARPRPTRCARPRPTRSPTALADGGRIEKVSSSKLRAGDVVVCERRRRHSRRRRGHRRHRHRRRVGDHRRKRAGHPRIGRRPQRRHRRHAGAVGSDQDQDHVESRRDVPRSHDRAGRRRGAPEDAERDRAEHPDRRPDAHLPASPW